MAAADAAEMRLAAARVAQSPALLALANARTHAASSPAAFAAFVATTAAAKTTKGSRRLGSLSTRASTATTTAAAAAAAGGGVPPAAPDAAPFLEEVSNRYANTIALAKVVGDCDTVMQSLLERGDVRAREGDLHGAAADWGACLDELSGCYPKLQTQNFNPITRTLNPKS
jgi:hypothetical protein